MKAAVRSKYGGPEILHVQEIDKPTPKEDEILIRVHSSTVNRSDCHVLTGKPFVMRLFTGLFKPRLRVTGCDFAGVIAAVGNKVTSFKVGDKVMGYGGALGCGSHAEYLALRKLSATILIPQNLNFKQAAACCEGTFYAACLIKTLTLDKEQNAMVYGATGAIGSAYVQFLRVHGVKVTAVCRGEHEDLIKSLGANRVIDYTTEDFTKDSERYDFIFDAVGKSSFLKCKHLLKKRGIYTSSGGFANFFWVFITPLFGGKKVYFKFPKDIKTVMEMIRSHVETEHFKPLIDREYSLDEISTAFKYVQSGQKVGNVILNLEA